MAEIKISLSNIQNVKTVNIEGVGVFKVRKLGAGESLDLSTQYRKLAKAQEELTMIDFDKYKSESPEDLKELEKISKLAAKSLDVINEVKRYELETFKKCFDDGGDGLKTKQLIDMLSEEERSELFSQIFDPIVVDTPDIIDNPVEQEEDEAVEPSKSHEKVKDE